MVEPQHCRAAQRVGLFDCDVRVSGEQRNQVRWRGLPPIELAGAEGRRGGGVIGHINPLDPVDLDDFASRGPVRRLVARHVFSILDVDCLMPGLKLRRDEFEGARPHGLGDLLKRIGLGEPLWHDKGRQARHFGKPGEQQRERLLQSDRKIFVVRPCRLVDHRGEALAERVARHPAPERGDAISPTDRLPVVKFEPVAQGEVVQQLVCRNAEIADHLRLRLEFRVECEQRVEHHVGVIAGHIGRGPVGVEDAQIVAHDEAQGGWVGGLHRFCGPKGREACCARCQRELTTRHPVSHPGPPLLGLTEAIRARTGPSPVKAVCRNCVDGRD